MFRAFRWGTLVALVLGAGLGLAREPLLVMWGAVPANSPAGFMEDVQAMAPLVLFETGSPDDPANGSQRDAYVLRRAGRLGTFRIDREGLADLVKETLAAGESWEPEIRALLEQHAVSGATVLDVGAHIGTHTLPMARAVGATGHVFAFEPQRKLFRELVGDLADNRIDNVTPLRFAVGDGPARLVEIGREATNEGGASIGEAGDGVELRTIDSFGFTQVPW